ncbi:MAG TPA: type I-B CRISPR-associated protein Cas7/Csh2 [Candidatus Kapabacteria bacterium]|nr:type I-B CRISPR-associated protein Cas7/Csh2 [Candidatus Kapabacteria bacterium]
MVDKRSELLFCYDVTDANPNGDPMDENKPRIDEETGINIVTDVRLKRTVRDYLYNYRGFNGTAGKDILVREIPAGDFIQDAKMRAEDFLKDDNQEKIDKRAMQNIFEMREIIERNVKTQCIDLRLFGVTLPIELNTKSKNKKESSSDDDSKSSSSKNSSITYTGPVQFKMGRSLHQVEPKHIKGTGAFATKKEKQQKGFREEHVLHYSFIAFHGIVNETAAAHTGLTDEDVKELLSALWKGTQNLISRSKFGQMPRLLLKVTYKEKGFFIGDLDKKIKVTNCKNDNPLKIRGLKDFVLDVTELLAALEKYAAKIESIEYVMDENLRLSGKLPETFKSLTLL